MTNKDYKLESSALCPISASAKDGRCEITPWNRKYTLDGSPFLSSIISGGEELLASPMRLVGLENGKEIIVMEPVKGGALAKVPATVKEIFAASAHPERTPAEWALRFCAGLEGVIMVLSGMSDMDQLKENTAFMDKTSPLTEEETAMLFRCADEINQSVAVSCTGCAYCTADCPKQIPIPEWFDLYNKNGNPADLAKDHTTPADCIACGKCEKLCPQKLPIRRLMVAAKEALKL